MLAYVGISLDLQLFVVVVVKIFTYLKGRCTEKRGETEILCPDSGTPASLPHGYRGPSTWAILRYFPRLSMGLNWKWNNHGSNQHLSQWLCPL